MKCVFLAVLGLCGLGDVMAEHLVSPVGVTPSWASQLTLKKQGNFPALKPARYTYLVTWKGEVNAGKVVVEYGNPANKKAGMFVVSAKGESTGLAAALYEYRGFFWSEMDERTHVPRLFTGAEDVEGKHVKHEISFSGGAVKTNQKTKELDSGKEYENTYEHTLGPIHDLFSGMLWVRSQPLADGDELCFIVQPGDTPYLVRVKVLKREKFGERAAIKLSISMQKIVRETLELKAYKKMKSANLWISDDEERALLEIRASVFIGDVRVTLDHKDEF